MSHTCFCQSDSTAGIQSINIQRASQADFTTTYRADLPSANLLSKNTLQHPPLLINSAAIKVVGSVQFLGTTITSNLRWETHSSIIQGHQRMFFLGLLQKVCTQFYRAITKHVLRSFITVWYPTSSCVIACHWFVLKHNAVVYHLVRTRNWGNSLSNFLRP